MEVISFNIALGNEEGKLEFNKNEYRHSSSFYDIAYENENFPSSKTTKIKVDITKLDTIANQLTFLRDNLHIIFHLVKFMERLVEKVKVFQNLDL